MNQISKFFLFICFILLLQSCTGKQTVYAPNIVDENWWRETEINPDRWKIGASRWFLLGMPSKAEIQNRRLGGRGGITTATIQTRPFTCINTQGNFELQIYGSDRESVAIYGPNAGTQAVSVNVSGRTLFITQTKQVPIETMEHVIVRVGIRQLQSLTQAGAGNIEAVHVVTRNLRLSATGSGRIFLAGRIHLSQISQTGRNCIFIFGARSRNLNIITASTGLLNISGFVGLKSITHRLGGDINIVGAYSDGLFIDAKGAGRIALCGVVNLCSVNASDAARVYIKEVRGDRGITMNLSGQARVGVMGSASTITVNACNSAVLQARFLCVRNAYVNAHGFSHVNVSAATKAFVYADNRAAVNFYGASDALESFGNEHGNVYHLPGLPSCTWYHFKVQRDDYVLDKPKKKRIRRIREIMRPGEG